jgi:N-acetyl-anhydromuramyl-L-alanine amidase AmpD
LKANPVGSGGATRSFLKGVVTGLAVTFSSLPAHAAETAAPAQQSAAPSLQSAFTSAALEFRVPVSVLLSVSYNVSRWEHHKGAPSVSGGYGPMHLTRVDSAQLSPRKDDESSEAGAIDFNDPSFHTLEAAAQLLGVAPEQLQQDPAQNVRGGAALLAQYARYTLGREPSSAADWYGAVAMFSGSSDQAVALDFADTVYATIQQGLSRTTLDGETVTLTAEPITPNTGTVAALALRSSTSRTGSGDTECPEGLACDSVPAAYVQNSSRPTDYGNYDVAARPHDGLDIRYIVIHDTETTYNSTLALFTNPRYKASAHYVVRSSDGHVAQMVPTAHVAWHAGNWYVNAHSLGIEHEGVAIQGAAWYNEQLYRASARLVRHLAKKFNVPLDRAHIVGHDNIPGTITTNQGSMHWDPGPFWDWGHYMNLLGGEDQHESEHHNKDILLIDPQFQTNTPAMTYCYTSSNCTAVPEQSASFVYLYTAPSLTAPLITNPFITAPGSRANNWANKAVAGQQFYRAEHRGDWDAIYFSGQKAWLYNPHHANTKSGRGVVITPKAGLASIPLYGRAYPEAAAYPTGINPQSIVPLTPYSIPAGQRYVAEGPFPSDYYYSPTYAPQVEGSDHRVVVGQTLYYQVSFNHRFAFVKASDVDVVPADEPGHGGSED